MKKFPLRKLTLLLTGLILSTLSWSKDCGDVVINTTDGDYLFNDGDTAKQIFNNSPATVSVLNNGSITITNTQNLAAVSVSQGGTINLGNHSVIHDHFINSLSNSSTSSSLNIQASNLLAENLTINSSANYGIILSEQSHATLTGLTSLNIDNLNNVNNSSNYYKTISALRNNGSSLTAEDISINMVDVGGINNQGITAGTGSVFTINGSANINMTISSGSTSHIYGLVAKINNA